MVMIKKILLVLLFIVILCGVAFAGIYYFPQDEPLKDDSDLLIEIESIDEQDNGYQYFKEAAEKNTEILNETNVDANEVLLLLRGELDESELSKQDIEDLLKKSQEAITLFNKAVNLPKYRDPKFEDPNHTSLFSDVMGGPGLIKIVIADSIFDLENKNIKDVFDVSFDIMEFAEKRNSSVLGMTDYLINYRLSYYAIENIQYIMLNFPLPNKDLAYLLTKLDAINADNYKDDYIRAWKAVYMWSKEMLGVIYEESGYLEKAAYNFKYNKTLNHLADYTRGAIEYIEENTCEIYEGEIPAEKFNNEFEALITENGVGKIFLQSFLLKYNTNTCVQIFQIEGLKTLIAVKMYQNDNEKLPDSLDELVPDYLDEIPIDPYSGKEILYNKQNRIIYSIGEDKEDNGGLKETEEYSINIGDPDEPTIYIGDQFYSEPEEELINEQIPEQKKIPRSTL
jgi:hypothetical protein